MKKYRIKLGELVGNVTFLRTADSLISVYRPILYKVYKQPELYRITLCPGAYSPEVQGVQRTPCNITGTRAANSIEFYSNSSSSSAYFSKSEFKFEFSNLIIYEFKFEFDKNKLFRVQVRVQADEYPKSRQLFHRRCSCNEKDKNISLVQ